MVTQNMVEEQTTKPVEQRKPSQLIPCRVETKLYNRKVTAVSNNSGLLTTEKKLKTKITCNREEDHEFLIRCKELLTQDSRTTG